VQTAETFKVIREILTCWLLLKQFVATTNRLFYVLLIIFLRAKRITIINVVHFLKKRCLVAFVVRNLIFFN